jgi:hypothetical protein
MTEASKSQKPKVEELELNRETVQDLSEREAEQGRGGAVPQTNRNCNVCTEPETTCI